MPIVTESDGSSTVMTGSGRGSSRVGERLADRDVGIPATAMISPGPGLVGLDAVERLGHVELADLARSTCRRRGTRRSAWPRRIVPWRTRQSARRPT